MSENLELSITIPAENVELFLECFSDSYGYKSEIMDGNNQMVENPVSPAEFAKQRVAAVISDMLTQFEINKAAKNSASRISIL